MFGIKEPFDLPSFVVVLLTFILFVVVKGSLTTFYWKPAFFLSPLS
jgi:hypothetical protein